MERGETLKQMVDWINENEFFWVEDFRKAFDVHSEFSKNKEAYLIHKNVIGYLKKYNFIQCSEVKGNFRQYMVVKPIVLADIKLGKSSRYTN